MHRANGWAEELRLDHVKYIPANAAVVLRTLLSTYPGRVRMVCVQYPDPHVHRQRHVVQKGFARMLAESLPSGGEMGRAPLRMYHAARSHARARARARACLRACVCVCGCAGACTCVCACVHVCKEGGVTWTASPAVCWLCEAPAIIPRRLRFGKKPRRCAYAACSCWHICVALHR